MTGRAALRYVAENHRHLKRELAGALFAVGAEDDTGKFVGVAVATNGPRVWQGTGRLNIARVCTDGTPNACSFLLGAICRAARALGYVEAWTYTLPEEPGTSLRAAGFEHMGTTPGGEHGSASRPRKPAEQAGPKNRWRKKLKEHDNERKPAVKEANK